MTKWIMGVAVVVVVGAGLWWWFGTSHNAAPAGSSQTATTTEQTNGMSNAGDTSNQALVRDTAAIDAQIQGLSQDSASADQSMSDQPVSQAY